MHVLNRRRFLAISAAAAGTFRFAHAAQAETTRHWLGTALGARASIRLHHPEADRIIKAVRFEIERLEQIFSLYRSNSELSQLNRDGRLVHPSFEMVELLSLCGTVHAATLSAFDPTIQSLWSTYAEHHSKGQAPQAASVNAALEKVGWSNITVSPERIEFKKAGMAITLNGIAQGYIADKVASLLRSRGLDNILVDTGELYALGAMPKGSEWTVELRSTSSPVPVRRVRLADAAIATSEPLGTAFDAAGRVGHIIDPRTGYPAKNTLSMISVRAPTAARADAYSTAMCLLSADEIAAITASQKDLHVIVTDLQLNT